MNKIFEWVLSLNYNAKGTKQIIVAVNNQMIK